MTDIDPKALEHACQCAGRSVHHFDRMALDLPLRASIIAHARAIERIEALEATERDCCDYAKPLMELQAEFEAFRREVSDVLEYVRDNTTYEVHPKLWRFILPKPDPLVEVAREMTLLDGVVRTDNQKAAIREGRAGNTASNDFYDRLRAALAARGLEIREVGHD